MYALLFLPMVHAWTQMSTLRNILSIHAFASTVLRQIKDELLQKQVELFISPSTFYEKLFDLSTTDPIIHFVLHLFTAENAFYMGVLISSCVGYEYYNSPKYAMYKLNDLFEYKELQKKIRILCLVFVIILFRDVDNAI